MTTIRPATKAEVEKMEKNARSAVLPVDLRRSFLALCARIRLLDEIVALAYHSEECNNFSTTECCCGLAEKLARLEEVDREP